MNKIKEITETLQTEIDDSKIISQLTELYQVYLQEKNENHEFINNYLINLNLPLILCKSIKQNFSQINQNWFIAYQLSCFLLDIILSSNNTNLNDFQINIIIDSHLILLKRLQKNYLLKKESIINLETTRDEYLNLIRLILNNLKKLIQYSTKILYLLLKSPCFLQLFITDNKEFSLLLIEFFIVCINLSPESFDRLKHSLKIDILDELIYHLSIMNNSEMIQKIIKSLVVLLIKIPGLSKTIVKRYRGIQLLLMKWLDQFTNKSNGVVSTNVSMETTQTILDKNEACRQLLTQLIDLINESQIPTAKEKKSEMIVNRKKTLENKNIDVRQAAIIIQSNWRGYSDRKKIKRMNESIGLLQRHFREHQLKKLENEQQVQLEKDFQIMITMNRHKRYREKLETEIKLWSSLPGCLVENEWNKERELAAVSIQRHYRGYCARKYLKNQRDYLKRDKAARTIQLNFRKYLSRLECASSGKNVFKIDPTENNLINNKKLEITMKEVLREHQKWCETHQQSMRPINQLEDVHKETQIKIGQYRRDYRVNSIKSQTRQVTLTRMKIDADLLLNEFTEEDKQLKNEIKLKKTTTLNEIVDKHIENSDLTNAFSQFTCRVQPLARLAQMEHHDRMTRMNLNKSWWNIFMDEWRKKQDEYIQSHNKTFSDLTDTDVTNQNVDNDDLSWLPDRFIEELERRDIFQR
uniref:IQ calmodulin-binding motif family protein n=1 Tax=Schistosoma mansoni TaxID=6183 RepID=A0A5K4FCW2_SCHMA